jgi:hypothetical protein
MIPGAIMRRHPATGKTRSAARGCAMIPTNVTIAAILVTGR